MTNAQASADADVPPELERPLPRQTGLVAEPVGVCAECAESLLIDPLENDPRIRVCRSRANCERRQRLFKTPCFHCGCALSHEGDALDAASDSSDATVSIADTASEISDIHDDASDVVADRFMAICEHERGLREHVLSYLDPVSIVRLSICSRHLDNALSGRFLDLLQLDRHRWFARADLMKLLVSRSVRRRWILEGIALDCRGALSLEDVLQRFLTPMALRSLALRGCSDSALAGIGACRWLLRLDLSRNPVSDLTPIGDALRDLRELKLEDCEDVRSLVPLRHCTEMQTLLLGGCRNLHSLRGIETMLKLQRLDLSSCFELFVAESTSAAMLGVHTSSNISYVLDDQEEAEVSLASLSSIKILSLQGCSQLVRAPALPPLLEELDMSSCEQLVCLKSLRGCSKTLRSLALASNDALASLDATRALSQLEAIDCSNCYSLRSVKPLSACARLQTAQFSGCIRLSSAALGGCAALRRLTLTGATALSDIAELSRCQALEHVDLPFCSSLRSVAPLAHCGSLRFLNLTRSEAVADVTALATNGSLRELHVRWCPQISLTALQQLPPAIAVTYA